MQGQIRNPEWGHWEAKRFRNGLILHRVSQELAVSWGFLRALGPKIHHSVIFSKLKTHGIWTDIYIRSLALPLLRLTMLRIARPGLYKLFSFVVNTESDAFASPLFCAGCAADVVTGFATSSGRSTKGNPGILKHPPFPADLKVLAVSQAFDFIFGFRVF